MKILSSSNGKSICKSLPKIYRSKVFIYLHKSKKVSWNQKNCKSALILRLARQILLSASQYLKPWRFCWVRKTSLWQTLVLQIVLSYYIAFYCCNRLVILLLQLSLEFERLTEFDIHNRFDEKLWTYVSNILNVTCTVRKEKFVVLQTKM